MRRRENVADLEKCVKCAYFRNRRRRYRRERALQSLPALRVQISQVFTVSGVSVDEAPDEIACVTASTGVVPSPFAVHGNGQPGWEPEIVEDDTAADATGQVNGSKVSAIFITKIALESKKKFSIVHSSSRSVL